MVATSKSPSVKDTYLSPLAAAKLLTSPAAGARAMRVPPPTRPGLGSTLESKAGRFRKREPSQPGGKRRIRLHFPYAPRDLNPEPLD